MTQLASVIITNFDQGRFLRAAIDSALAQTYPAIEVIVVDDGSTDDSASIARGYGDSVVTVLKENGGQASAINAGFVASRGEFVYFLDADDLYAETTVANSIGALNEGAVKVHWPYQVTDAYGEPRGRPSPASVFASGNLTEHARRYGPGTHRYPPTSANAATRGLMNEISPVPEHAFKTGADMYIAELAAFAGPLAVASDALTFYRRHEANDSTRFTDGLSVVERWAAWYEACVKAASTYCVRRGIAPDVAEWRNHGWPARLRTAVSGLGRVVPDGEEYVLIDDDAWDLAGRLPGSRRFAASNGEEGGAPADDEALIAALDRCAADGTGHVALLWNAYWWRDYYPRAFAWLEERSTHTEVDGVLTVYTFK